jgi:hypothetical protein
MMEFQQPFELSNIKKYPAQVLIAILVALLIYFINRADTEAEEVERLNARIDTINTERLRLYDRVIFQDYLLKNMQKNAVPVEELKEQTEPQVKQILKQAKP